MTYANDLASMAYLTTSKLHATIPHSAKVLILCNLGIMTKRMVIQYCNLTVRINMPKATNVMALDRRWLA